MLGFIVYFASYLQYFGAIFNGRCFVHCLFHEGAKCAMRPSLRSRRLTNAGYFPGAYPDN